MEVNTRKTIDKLFSILTEIDARDGGNCVVSELINKSWVELCDDAIELLKSLKI